MAVRQTGFALLASASVQEAHDLALVSQAATLQTRVPFVHFFDGFRTSHELNTIDLLSDDDLRALVPESLVRAHRGRALSPERPFIRGTAQNPDVYFQARETVNPFYARVPGAVEDAMAALAERTGRRYHVVDYTGHPEAENVIVVMGSAGETVVETVAALVGAGQRVGVLQVRLYRPFPAEAFAAALPASVRSVAVLDRTKEPGSVGEPFFLDVVAALMDERESMPKVIGGRYGLSSKELTPGMVAGVFAELANEKPRRRFTVGIVDDVSGTSLDYDASLDIEPADACARSSSAWAPTGRWARTRTRSRSSAPRRACTRRATSSTTRRSPARRPCRTSASGRSRSTRPTSCSRRASSAATTSVCSTAPMYSAARRPARRSCSTARTRRTRSGTRSRARSRSRSSPSRSTSTRSTPAGSRARRVSRGGST